MITAVIDATCEYVEDGDTFRTSRKNWIRLANVCAPELSTAGGAKAKRILAELIFGKRIRYKKCGSSYGRLVADVWVGNLWVNAHMRQLGYTC